MSYPKNSSKVSTSVKAATGRVRSLVILGILAVACLALLLFVTLPANNLAWSSIQNVGHFFLFAVLAIIYIAHLDKILRSKFVVKLIFTLVVLTIIGFMAEIAQTLLPARSASSEDLWRNFAGVATGLIAYSAFRYRRKLNPAAVLLIVMVLASIFILVCRPAIELVGYRLLKSAPPSVITFSDPFVESMISNTGGANSTLERLKLQTGGSERHTLRMDFAQQPYSGVILHEPGYQWPDSANLALQLFNPGSQSRRLELRIHDTLHTNSYEDRFNTNFHVKPGENNVLIPVSTIRELGGKSNARSMDIQKISELQFFSTSKELFTLYLTGIVLTQK